MQSIFDAITEWLKALLVEGIMENLGGLFMGVNEQVGEIAAQVGMTPAAWNAGVFSMIRQLSETVILPIAGLVLTFVMTYELIQMLVDHNNLHNFDTWIFFKWIFKTFAAVLVLSNTFNIVMAVFDVSQHVVQQSAGLIQGSTAVTPEALENMQAQLEAMELGPLLGIFLQSFFVQFTMTALNIVVFVIVYGRMIEIYLMTSLAPIPFATIANREAGHMGHNYFKSLFAVGFQGMLIMVCMAIYAVLVQGIATGGDLMGAIWTCVGTRCCCASSSSRPGASRSPYGERTKGLRANLARSRKGGIPCREGLHAATRQTGTGTCAPPSTGSSRRNLTSGTCWPSRPTQTFFFSRRYQKRPSPPSTRRAMTIGAGPSCPGPERRKQT